MRRWLNILVFFGLSVSAFAQIDTHIVDSLQEAYATQEGRDKVLTMIELTWDFYDVSFDDCISWGEKAIKEANALGYKDLEARANYVLGIQYGYHSDLDLAREYLQKSYNQYNVLSDTKNAFESLWHLATYELTLGSIDTAYVVYEKALPLTQQLNDTSANAYVLVNMGLIWYKRSQNEMAIKYFEQAKRMFEAIGDERMAIRMGDNMATICAESGQAVEALELFRNVIPKLEEFEDYYHLLSVCLTMGTIYENEIVNYDSAMYYLGKALAYAEMPMRSKESKQLAENEKSEAMVEIGNVLVKRGETHAALAKFEEALRLAESNAYPHGQMEACLGLGKEYSRLGQAAKSLQYFSRFFELEKASGVKMMRPSVKKALIMDYARLGMFSDLETELADFEEDYSALLRERDGIKEELLTLRQEASELLEQYESQNLELQKYQSKAENYRLAFYGLLAIVLSACVLFLLYKIVRKNRNKTEKG